MNKIKFYIETTEICDSEGSYSDAYTLVMKVHVKDVKHYIRTDRTITYEKSGFKTSDEAMDYLAEKLGFDLE